MTLYRSGSRMRARTFETMKDVPCVIGRYQNPHDSPETLFSPDDSTQYIISSFNHQVATMNNRRCP